MIMLETDQSPYIGNVPVQWVKVEESIRHKWVKGYLINPYCADRVNVRFLRVDEFESRNKAHP